MRNCDIGFTQQRGFWEWICPRIWDTKAEDSLSQGLGKIDGTEPTASRSRALRWKQSVCGTFPKKSVFGKHIWGILFHPKTFSRYHITWSWRAGTCRSILGQHYTPKQATSTSAFPKSCSLAASRKDSKKDLFQAAKLLVVCLLGNLAGEAPGTKHDRPAHFFFQQKVSSPWLCNWKSSTGLDSLAKLDETNHSDILVYIYHATLAVWLVHAVLPVIWWFAVGAH